MSTEQTRCDLFGHDFKLWKEGGKSYMKCGYCPATRHVTIEDLKATAIPDFDDRPQRKPVYYDEDMEDWWGFGG